MKKKRFQLGGSFYEIPENEISSFLQDNPKAIEVKFYDIKGSKYNIPVSEVDAFEIDMGLKKKDLQPVSQTGGKAGTSVLPSGLTPSKIEVKEYKEPVVGEDTMLTRKMERAQKQAISGTEVRLPAAPKAVAAERGMQRAVEPMVEKPTEIDETKGFFNAIDRGALQGQLADMMALGQMPKREDLKEIARINKQMASIPSTGAYERFNSAPDLKTAVKEFAQNPFEITSQLIGESLAAQIRHGYSRAVAGAGTGAALGSVVPGIGTAAGAGTGFVAGMGVAGYNLEMASSIMDSFREAGVDVTDEKSLQKAFDDSATLKKARDFANKRAVPIALFDMFSAGMGGKLLGKPAKTMLGKVGRAVGEVGIQTGFAGAGETTAQVVSGKKINPTAIFSEMIGQVGGGAPDIIVGTVIEKKKAGQPIKKDVVQLDIKPEELQDMLDISEAAGEITDVQAEEIKQEFDKIQKVKQAVPEQYRKNADIVEALEQKRELEAQKQGLDPVFARKIDEQIKALDTKIDNTIAAGEVAPEAAPEVPIAPAQAPVIEGKVEAGEVVPEVAPEVSKPTKEENVGFTKKGGNKIVDEKGEPITLLHGTNNDKIKFDEGTVFYATDNKQFAGVYGENILPVKISLKNPYDLTDSTDGIIKDRNGEPMLDKEGFPYSINYIDESVVKDLKSRGFDGVRMGNESVVAFDKSQVKEITPQVPAAPEKIEPIRQLGTGANVYFENEKYRVNDFKDKVLVNVQGTGDTGVIANLEFDTPEEAVDVAKTLNKLYPQGVPEAVLLDKVVEDIKAGKYKEVVGEVAAEAAPEVPAAPIKEELPFGETAPREAVETKEEKNLTRRALNLEVSTPRAEVLQYFISGGKISPEALTEFFGKERRMGMGKIRVEERRSRTSLTNKNAPSIEALAEKIAGTDRLDQVQEYREAIEEALLNHSGTKTMAEELVRDYDVEFAEMKRAAELEELGQEIEAEVQAFVSQIPPAQQEEIMKVLDKFRDNDGFIDWKKIDEETKFGFEPVLLELSEPSQKIINDAIKQFEETGRVGRISPEVISEKEVKEVKPETYAIQEQAAGEVPVQPEAGVSEEVEGGVPPTEPPTTTEEGKAEGEEREMTGISNAETEKMRLAMGIPEFERPEPETWEQLNEQADEAIKKGYNIEKLLTKIENGNIPNSLEVVILSKYGAALSKKFDINQDKEVLKQYERFTNATNSIGTIAGRSFNARKTLVPKEDTLADFFVLEKEETGVDELTEEQKATLIKEYNEIKAATEALQKKVEQLQEENARMLAGEVVTEERKKAKKTRKTSQDFAQERKQIVDDIRQKLKEARQQSKVTVVPYANELIAIAPDVAKLVKSLVEQGVIKLEDIVIEIHANLKEDIEGLTKKDVTDLIAGEYNRKKPTRGAIAEKIRDLKDEAKLITKLEKLQQAELPKDPIKKIERSREIKQLKDKIKEHPNTKLSEAKIKIATQIKKLEKDIAEGNYDKKPEKREIPLDKEGKELQKKLIQLRRDRDVRRLKNEYQNRNQLQKFLDKVAEIGNIPRSLMASTDFSAPLNQAVVATIAYPDLTKKATEQMIKATSSQEAFDQWFYDLKDDLRYDLMKELKLRIADPHSPFLTAREEAFMSGYAEQIPGLGKLVKASERAYVQYLNKLRVDLFNRFVDRFEEQGKTYANRPKLYEATVKYINNITGSGNLPKNLEQFSPVFSALLFSPRLMAARINMLNPFYFATLPTELKIQYGKDMGKFLGLASTIITLFALYGKTQDDDDEDKITVETDPTSTDFARIKQGNTRWDILGGFQPYVRLMNQMITGEKKSATTGLKQSLDGEGAFGKTRGDVLASFFRNKLAPVPGMAVNFVQGRNGVGEKVTLEKELFSHIIPLSMQTIGEAIKEGGPSKVVSAGLPAVFGIGVQTYGDRPKEVKEEIEYRNREVKLTKEQKKFFQDVYDEISKKNLDKLKASREYKSVERDVQVDLENIVKKAAMKKAETRLTQKYAKEFLKFPVIQEDRKVKSIKEKVKSQF